MTFETYYRARRGFDPFPWMRRLADRFAAGDMPDVIDLPTGSGKSDVVLVWAWARTVRPELPRRLWAVSDRRVIVDQTYRIGLTLEGDGIRVSRLRGGIKTNPDDILDPVTPQIVAATVDQVGSRLLFRGYGSSPRSWPIWAGLVGHDSLILLDEAHNSPNAEDTFRACRTLGAGAHVISMTATPRGGTDIFGLEDEDHAHPILGQRLRARRLVELREAGHVPALVTQFLKDGHQRVAVICNTVRSARATFEAIAHDDKHLIIGRQRPLDRDRLMADLEPRLRSGADATAPLVVVTTQAIEAGADFDFDAMVTEPCPIDALRQRIGRLDRLGNMGESRCIMFGKPDKKLLPYGASPRATWDWLAQKAEKRVVDLGFAGWQAIRDDMPEETRSARPETVSLLEPHVRMLARTSPRPRIEPDVDMLLHGPNSTPGAISIIWREDIRNDAPDTSAEIMRILPPSALESCEVPLHEVQAWLGKIELESDTGDMEGGELQNGFDVPETRVFRWLGLEDGIELITADELRPGDMIIVPSTSAGYDRFGWAPQSIDPVPDLVDDAFMARTGRTIERKPDAEDSDDTSRTRVHRWEHGVVIEHLGDDQKSRIFPPEILLDTHQHAVAERAAEYAEALGLDVSVLRFSGLHHDDGKAELPWQLTVNGDDLTRLATPLAKGTYVPSVLMPLPKRWRHEAASLERLPDDAPALVRWLIATHHGYARPFWPTDQHGIGLAELMDQMHHEHGFWGIALLEAVLRCADRTISKEEVDHAA